ncbi:MAG: hypothetical protein EP332_02985 [Bacteroidetes bacterium]|nr:MAG: hypothetical protein EP332_02985 [Bacteroidota bacterium]
MRKALLVSLLCGAVLPTWAQNEMDVARFSQKDLMGTPRILAMGGSGSAMGADLSSLSLNPAGLAFYRGNEYNISLGFHNKYNSSYYIDRSQTGSKANLMIPQIGMVFTQKQVENGQEKMNGLVSFSLGLSVQRRSDFNQRRNFSGINSSSSMLDMYALYANGTDAAYLNGDNESLEGLAWNTYLINPDSFSNNYYANLPDTISVYQQSRLMESGKGNDYNLGIGLNFSHEVYIGFGLTFSSIQFEHESSWEEQTLSSFASPREMRYHSNYTTTGNAIQFQAGVILKPNDYFRIGLSYHSRPYYSLYEQYIQTMESKNFLANQSFNLSSSYMGYAYNVRTPSQLLGGITFLIPKTAVFNVDVEFQDYTTANISSVDYDYNDANTAIQKRFGNTTNVRTGGEFLLGAWRLRAGYAFQQSLLKPNLELNLSSNTNSFTFGGGYRNKSGFFVDGAFTFSQGRNFITPYNLDSDTRESYTAVNDFRRTQVILSFGSRF